MLYPPGWNCSSFTPENLLPELVVLSEGVNV